MKKKIIYSLLAGFSFALIFGIYLLMTNEQSIAIVVTIFLVIVSPISFYFKMFSKIDYSFEFIKIEKASILHSGNVNYYIDGMPIGGTLYLLKDKLIFQTNFLSFIKRHQAIIQIDQIKEIDFFDNLGLIKNGFTLRTVKNTEENFTSFKRQVWKDNIEREIKHDS